MFRTGRPDARAALGLILGLALLLATRWSWLFGENAALDGDESILALMAKHLAEGRELPVYFYGQSFGIALFEVAPVALFFLLFGVSISSVKAAILVLWTIGWLFFASAVRRATNSPYAWVAAVLLVLCPAWTRWSTLARGYHVAGFVLAQIAVWMTVRACRDDRPRRTACALLGALVGLLVLTQSIWFISFAPFLAMLLFKRRKPSDGLALALGLVSIIAVVFVATWGRQSSYWSPDFLRSPDPWLALKLLPERVWIHLSGAYAYGSPTEAGPFTATAATLWSLVLLGAVIRGVGLWSRPKAFSLGHACALGIALVLAASLLIDHRAFGYRYLLPLTGLLVTFFAAEAPDRRAMSRGAKALAGTAVALLGVFGVASLIEARRLPPSPVLEPTSLSASAAIETLIDDLTAGGIHHVYCLHPTFQWNIIFSSNEQVLARWYDPADRRPEYPEAVDRAFLAGRPVALVGTAAQWARVRPLLLSHGLPAANVRVSGGRYFWVPAPSLELLQAFGFRFRE